MLRAIRPVVLVGDDDGDKGEGPSTETWRQSVWEKSPVHTKHTQDGCGLDRTRGLCALHTYTEGRTRHGGLPLHHHAP